MESLRSEKMRWSAQHRISLDNVPVWCPLTAALSKLSFDFYKESSVCVCVPSHVHDMYALAARACYRYAGMYMRL